MNALITAWQAIEDELLPALAHHLNADDEAAFITPMRTAVQAACSEADRLRAALWGIIGVDSAGELREMEIALRLMPAPAADKAAMIDAIHALLGTKA